MLYNIGFKPLLVPIVKIFWSLGVRCRARVQDLDKVVSAHFTWGTSNQYCDACFRIHSDAVNKGLNDTTHPRHCQALKRLLVTLVFVE
jgi:hypothetical protein